MHTEEWFQNRPVRARNRILKDRDSHCLSFGTLLGALDEMVSGADSPTEEHARLLASALQCLMPEEFRCLVEEGRRDIKNEIDNEAWRALDALDRGKTQQPSAQSIGALASLDPSSYDPPLSHLALVLRALRWAITPPTARVPSIVF